MQGTWENGRYVLASTKDDKIARLEREKAQAIRALEIKAAANEEAAKRSPQHADWSNGVAKGMREAIDILSNAPHQARRPAGEELAG